MHRRLSFTGTFWWYLTVLAIFLGFDGHVSAQPATVPYHDCFSGNVSQKLNVSTVYAQILENDSLGRYMNLTVLGESGQDIIGFDNNSHSLATLFTNAEMLTFEVFTNSSYFCRTLLPPSPLPSLDNQTNYCPIAAGPFAFSTTVQFKSDTYELVTLDTQLRAVDPYSNELFCVDVYTTPLFPGPLGSVYGRARITFWATVALAIAYWLVVGIARIVSAWGRGASRLGPGLWSRVESAGFILASAISGERLAKSPALMRYGTPSMRDIIFHTQWCAALGMVAVQWPTFVYPLFAQTAWSTLSYNISITQRDDEHWNPLSVIDYNPPSTYSDQFSDPTSVLYIDASAPNTLFMLPNNASNGIASFAYAVGLRPQDLFGICLILFLAIIAATIALSLLIWSIDWIASLFDGTASGAVRPPSRLGLGTGTRSPRYSGGSKDLLEGIAAATQNPDEDKSHNSHFLFRAATKLPTASKSWWRLRPGLSSFHGSVLHGNLLRILILFHLPVTIFSCYQMTLGRSQASLTSIVLAALSFALFSVLVPAFLVIRLTLTSTNKLYDETRTLLSFGPLYNHYRHGSQLFACLLFATNLVFGITIGCGQKSGTAQAIIILIVEMVTALGTSLWLPWGQGASMGLISFLFCVARIVIAVLLVILTPTVSIGEAAGAWVAYAILFIVALIYLAFLVMLLIKLVEGVVRIAGGVGFDRSRHVVDSGLFGACGLLGFYGSRGRHRSRRRHHYRASEVLREPSELSSLSRPQKPATPTHSGPPSVLRPEHALRPYREDSDDESGYIMGAWQPFPRPGYSPVKSELPQLPEPSTAKSGFSRVGGGRAHFENPYAIASGSTVSFPSADRKADSSSPESGTPQSKMNVEEDSPPPTPSMVSQSQLPVLSPLNLPPGAMPPAHVRTKSQTAIIEDASALFNPAAAAAAPSSLPGESTRPQQDSERPTHEHSQTLDDDWASEITQPKRKHWYNIRKPRRYSEGNPLQMNESDLEADAEPASRPAKSSFVVIRDRKPSAIAGAPSRSRRSEGGTTTSEHVRPKSFVVLRGNSPSEPSAI